MRDSMYDEMIASHEREERVSEIELGLLVKNDENFACDLLRKSKNPEDIAAAARALAGWRYAPAEPMIAALAQEHRADPFLGKELAAALGKFGGQHAVDGLLRLVVFEGTAPVAGVAAHKALVGLGRGALWLLDIVLGEREWKRRTYFSTALKSRIEAELERLSKEIAKAGQQAEEQKMVGIASRRPAQQGAAAAEKTSPILRKARPGKL